MPVFRTKKEAFEWLQTGEKSIDVRKGGPWRGEIAVFLSGRRVLKMKITERESGWLEEIVRSDNYRLIVPSAVDVESALNYLRRLYVGYTGLFTAYSVVPLAY